MNQKQRQYLVKELDNIQMVKLADLNREFEARKPSIDSVLDGIKSGKVFIKEAHESVEINYNIIDRIPDETLTEMIKQDIIHIKGRQIKVTPTQYVEAVKRGMFVYDMSDLQTADNAEWAIQRATSTFLSNMSRNFEIPDSHSKPFQQIPEYVERSNKIKEEKKRLEREVMLGNDAKIIEMLTIFEGQTF